MSLLMSFAYLIASPLFNGIYPFTLSFFPGTMLLAVAALLILPVGILMYIFIYFKLNLKFFRYLDIKKI
ncbi:hypothetical protein Mgra_00003377 [Meloidogyne graminicola]|uniref:Uncharacterized protein n=1 Tax=Meloidogyne graminicola TaxID=189291 RepID=A0A8S9ZU22_9BILA|nr:hypothetical protein Mgra_00003377 [Meloidogyne graminicola]